MQLNMDPEEHDDNNGWMDLARGGNDFGSEGFDDMSVIILGLGQFVGLMRRVSLYSDRAANLLISRKWNST